MTMKNHWIGSILGIGMGMLGNLLFGYDFKSFTLSTLVVVAIAVAWGYHLRKVLK